MRRGERACPPEDCGGPWGYADYLAAIADPQHERHEELLEWRGPFDPEAFDAEEGDEGDEEGEHGVGRSEENRPLLLKDLEQRYRESPEC